MKTFSRTTPLSVSLVALTLTLAACGASSEPVTKTVTVERPAAPSDDSSGGSTDGSAGDSSSGAGDSVVDGGGAASGASGGRITVPNEVGKNHQAAQDDLQAHGLYNLSEEDATGEGRLLLFDRNWKVVSQQPAPGTKVNEEATITLRSEKYTDG